MYDFQILLLNIFSLGSLILISRFRIFDHIDSICLLSIKRLVKLVYTFLTLSYLSIVCIFTPWTSWSLWYFFFSYFIFILPFVFKVLRTKSWASRSYTYLWIYNCNCDFSFYLVVSWLQRVQKSSCCQFRLKRQNQVPYVWVWAKDTLKFTVFLSDW